MSRHKQPEPRSGGCGTADEVAFGSGTPLKPSVLLIDDMETLLFALGTGLRRYGHLVFTARSGREGIELFKTNVIDAVICDLSLEDMDGWQVGKRIREICQKSDRSKPPLILMTGLGLDIAEQQKMSSSGVDLVLEKPVEIPELLGALQQVTRS